MSPDRISRELIEKYDETVIEISLYGRTLNPDELYEDWKSDFYMITAANPFSRLLSEIENNNRNQLLFNLLSLKHPEILTALGRSPDGSWVEKGWVVRSSNQSEMVARSDNPSLQPVLARDQIKPLKFKHRRKRR